MPTKKSATTFSMADFEKGLMLVGLLTPVTAKEIREKEAVEALEGKKKGNAKASLKVSSTAPKQPKNLYFRRAVLAAEIVSSLHEEPTFGRVKFQKLVFLCERAALFNLEDHYKKLRAGPFDNKFMHSILSEFERQNWFTVENMTQASITRSVYKPLPGCDKYKKYYASYFKESNEEIQRVIELFRKKKTDFTEVSATLVACCVELIGHAIPVTEKSLLQRFYTWSEAKRRFDKTIVLKNWSWLQEQKLIPAAE